MPAADSRRLSRRVDWTRRRKLFCHPAKDFPTSHISPYGCECMVVEVRRRGSRRYSVLQGIEVSMSDERQLAEVRFLTVAEVASIMRVSKMTVYRMVHAGELPAIRVGRSSTAPDGFASSAPRARRMRVAPLLAFSVRPPFALAAREFGPTTPER